MAGENADIILMFDRGGWSPKLFASLDDQNAGNPRTLDGKWAINYGLM